MPSATGRCHGSLIARVPTKNRQIPEAKFAGRKIHCAQITLIVT
jgi:hypothetical protein